MDRMNIHKRQIQFTETDRKGTKNSKLDSLNSKQNTEQEGILNEPHMEIKQEQLVLGNATREKKIGILRRPEKNSLQNPFDINFCGLNKKLNHFNTNEIHTNLSREQQPTKMNNADGLILNLELNVPEFELTSKTLKKNTKTQKLSLESPSSSVQKINTPYWLKPTPMQIYPYNFIMAIRKKLESIANPSVSDSIANVHTPLTRPKYFQDQSEFRQNLSINCAIKSKSHKPRALILENIDDQNSINKKNLKTSLPSGGAPCRDSKDLSRSKWNKKKRGHSQDTISISSAIFSNSSLESKSIPNDTVIPLSTKHIDSIKMIPKINTVPKKSLPKAHPFINTKRGEYIDCAQHQNSISSISDDINQTNFLEKLEVFNKSVSEVISINEQLNIEVLSDQLVKESLVRNPLLNVSKEPLFEYSSSFGSITPSNSENKSDLFGSAKSTSPSATNKTYKQKHSSEIFMRSVPDTSELRIEKELELQKSTSFSNFTSFRENSSFDTSTSAKKEIMQEAIDKRSNDSNKNENFTNVRTKSSVASTPTFNFSTNAINEPLMQYNDNSPHQFDNNATQNDSSARTIYSTDNSQSSSIKYQHEVSPKKNANYFTNLNQSIGSDIFAIFNETQLEFSMASNSEKHYFETEGSPRYSNLGMVSVFFNFVT